MYSPVKKHFLHLLKFVLCQHLTFLTYKNYLFLTFVLCF